ncbi:MAG TPA: HAD family phosphatase [Casimicrobiaceae bacterium]|nr:HAD family phosphatase [Casimicrobiaceae bacterium]
MAATPPTRSVAIFDLGGVLLDWNPRFLYRKLFDRDQAAMEHFLATVCTTEWNERQDAGRTFAEATQELLPHHADKIELIEAFGKRFGEMIRGPIAGAVDVLAELKDRDVPLYALSNWSAETFPSQRERFEFLSWFDGIVISGLEGVIKPDPRIFRVLLERYGVAAESAVFIDDVPRNAAAASALGIHGIHYRSPEQLRRELVTLGMLPQAD